ncbi:alpha-aspartyl dipeptidase [Thrips palmi]|uniref:dipeptidase E n=1 Tax=Thrips palmi TaxID=161013 RepID=A0A6P8Z2X8_THRPL|nr:alpha-aspartyl dipeptidase [Thrips palmi]
MVTRRILLLSNSTLHNGKYLEWAKSEILDFLGRKNVKRILFVPYASSKHDDYTNTVKNALEPWGFQVEGVHAVPDPVRAVENAESIFVGGGNTFLLLKSLYENGLIPAIQKQVLENGMPYIGSSAGTNVATTSINTTNDMPIVYPPSFDALKLVPFNINPHYIDPDVNSTHMGETREKRISEYHEIEGSPPVLGLREGSLLFLEGEEVVLKGYHKARLFVRGKEPVEYNVGSDLSFLLSSK